MKSFAAKLVLLAVVGLIVAANVGPALYGFFQFTSKVAGPHWNEVENISRSINRSNG